MIRSYKYVKYVIMDAFLAYEVAGGSPNLTPWTWTVRFIPSGIANDTSTALQMYDTTGKYAESYKLGVNQKVRGIKFIFEKTSSTDTTLNALPTNRMAKSWIERIAVLWRPSGAARKSGFTTANVDKAVS
jgi:hypothetical protein